MVTKAQLHALIDALPDRALPEAQDTLERLIDPLGWALRNAPEDDEPETDEERAAVAEGLADLAAGRIVSHEDIRREFRR